MSTPHPEEVTEPTPMRWTEPFTGLIFAVLILAGFGVAIAYSYDSGDGEATEHDSGDDHSTEEDDGH